MPLGRQEYVWPLTFLGGGGWICDLAILHALQWQISTSRNKCLFQYAVSGPVQNLVVAINNTSVTITWSPPLDTNGVLSSYSLTLTNNTDFMMMTPVSNDTLEAVFRDLRPFGNYTISVRPFTFSDTIAGESSEETFTTEIGSELNSWSSNFFSPICL